MNGLSEELDRRLQELKDQGLYRRLRPIATAQSASVHTDGRQVLNFSSNDYLGLANEPLLKQAATQAIERYGAGAGASRLICGSLPPHQELEEQLAHFKGTEAALSFSSGYTAALGTIGALMQPGDVIILDKLVHACIVDAARFCGAKLRVFAHNDLEDLQSKLVWAQSQVRSPSRLANNGTQSQILIVTESVFSMDGDHAPLKELVELKNKFGAWLMVDEAHATGLYGRRRRGLAEELGVGEQIEIQMGTLGKAVGAAGGYISGSRILIEYLVNRARSFIFSTAPVPSAAAAAAAGIRLIQSVDGEKRRGALWERFAEVSAIIPTPASRLPSAILPILIGDETKAMRTAAALMEQAILLPAIRYPTVARGSARLRLTLSAGHTSENIAELRRALVGLGLATNTSSPPAVSHAPSGQA